jgi:hypothetical protein
MIGGSEGSPDSCSGRRLRLTFGRRRFWPLVALAFVSASCGARRMSLPSGPGSPAADMDQVVAESTGRCASVTSLTSEVAVSGSVTGRRLRARLLVGLAAPDAARVEAFAASQPVFILAARNGEATLLLQRENRVLERGRPADILEAIAGVPLDAAALRRTLLGCPPDTIATASGAGREIGDWRILDAGSTQMYFRRNPQSGPWRLAAVLHREPGRPEWRAEYRDFDAQLPRATHLVSRESGRFDLNLALSQVELNAPLPQTAFEVRIPPSAAPITIEELRRRGPFAAHGDDTPGRRPAGGFPAAANAAGL